MLQKGFLGLYAEESNVELNLKNFEVRNGA